MRTVHVMAAGVLEREAFRSSIDAGWPPRSSPLVGGLSPALTVATLAPAVVASRLVLPWIPATLVLAAAIVPLAPQIGLSPWVAGLMILTAANAWLVPRQSDFCRLMQDATKDGLFSHRQAALAGLAVTALTLVGLVASVPFWAAIGAL